MSSTLNYYSFLFLFSALILFSCTKRHHKDELETALKVYDRLIKKMDSDSIAMLYAPDGDLGEVAHGRDSIRKFLSSFKDKGISVLFVGSTSDSVRLLADTAFQTGHYKQTALTNFGKDTAYLKGKFSATWIWTKGEGWLIKNMATQPE